MRLPFVFLMCFTALFSDPRGQVLSQRQTSRPASRGSWCVQSCGKSAVSMRLYHSLYFVRTSHGEIAGGVQGAPVYRQHVNAGGPQLLGVCGVCACLPRGPVALTARSPGAPAFLTLSCWSPSGRRSPRGQAQAMLSPAGFLLAHAGARRPGASRPGGRALRGGACVAPPLGVASAPGGELAPSAVPAAGPRPRCGVQGRRAALCVQRAWPLLTDTAGGVPRGRCPPSPAGRRWPGFPLPA